MFSNITMETTPLVTNQFSTADVAAVVLREHGWLHDNPSPQCAAWLANAAALLGLHAADRVALTDLLHLIFHYDARAILESPESHAVISRQGAREVLRLLAHLILEGPAVDSDRYKAIITSLKDSLSFRGRELFYPIRLALAGRVGEGDLDRVILLLDAAAALPFSVRVKGTRQRILEFCSALD